MSNLEIGLHGALDPSNTIRVYSN